MELTKEIEVSKELKIDVGYNHETKSVVLSVNYDGKNGYSKLENGVKVVAILKEIAAKTSNQVDDVVVKALEVLIDKLA